MRRLLTAGDIDLLLFKAATLPRRRPPTRMARSPQISGQFVRQSSDKKVRRAPGQSILSAGNVGDRRMLIMRGAGAAGGRVGKIGPRKAEIGCPGPATT